MLHRFGAVVVTALVIASAVLVARRAPRGSRVRALAIAAPFVVLAQATLGVFSVTSLLHLPTVTAHLGVGALLLANMVAMWTLLPAASGGVQQAKLGERGAGDKEAPSPTPAVSA